MLGYTLKAGGDDISIQIYQNWEPLLLEFSTLVLEVHFTAVGAKFYRNWT